VTSSSPATSPSSDKPFDDPRLASLEALIRRSFRVRENETPIYVDVAGNLARIALDQHQIVFGRRGSGKSCLLIYFRRQIAADRKIHTVYMLGDTIKTLEYPDVLIRLLLAIFEGLPSQGGWDRMKRRLRRQPREADEIVVELRKLLALPSTSKLTVKSAEARSRRSGGRGGVTKGPAELGLDFATEKGETREEIREADDEKIRHVDNRLADYKRVIQEVLRATDFNFGAFIIDDFYLINPDYQPEVIDYLHRLLRDTDLYLKVGTIRHRTSLLRTSPMTIGVQLTQDVDFLNLDHTLEDIDRTQMFLEEMLRKMGAQVMIDDAPSLMSEEARKNLVLLSGGVPRDYLTIFLDGLERARRAKGRRRITPTDLRKAAEALSRETKYRDLRSDAGAEVPALETLFVNLVNFCLKEKKTTAFLIAKDDIDQHPEVHDLILQLMDFKLIHLVDESTSAASGRPGRYEAYTLDFALFMEPRRRNIEIVEFWRTDEQRRRVRLREAPDYPLERGAAVIAGEEVAAAEDALKVAREVPVDTETADELKLFNV
jgi:hypothetical protein